MKKLIKFIWQLPQNIIGLIILLINIRSLKKYTGYYTVKYLANSGISLGNYIILDDCRVPSLITVQHEQGHQKQSFRLGPLYLIVIGLPSLLGKIYDRLFHKNMTPQERYKWYYSQPWEKWADKLGNVKR